MALFTTTNWPVNALIEDIDLGKIGLPELQRPFVWPNVNVRNLFDFSTEGTRPASSSSGKLALMVV